MTVSRNIAAALAEMESDEKVMLDRALAMMKAYDGAVYQFDLLANAAVNRALALSSGFRSLIEAQNLICAGAILRLQLDTALRFYAGFIVEKPHDFAVEVLKGTHVRKLRDQSGQFMTDRYLVTQLAKEHAWIEPLYEHTSSYVHLSSTHIISTFDGKPNREKAVVPIKIGVIDREWPEYTYLDAIAAFRRCTELLLRHVNGWIFTKDNPETVASMRTAREASETTSNVHAPNQSRRRRRKKKSK